MPQELSVPDATPQAWIQPFYRSFNGLRGVAILLVFSCHYVSLIGESRVIEGMWVGVDLFFVLSGFLITGILYDSLRDEHYFRNFYTRRALRIFPIYYLLFLILWVLTHAMHASVSKTMLLYAVYVGNLALPIMDLAKWNPANITFPSGSVASIGYFWSLCVEEQFYLVWPLVVYLVRSRTTLMKVCVGGIIATVALRCFLYAHLTRYQLSLGAIYATTYSRADTLLIGALLALWLRGSFPSRQRLHGIASAAIAGAGTALAVGLFLTLDRWPTKWDNPFLNTAGYTLIAIVCAGVLMFSLDDTSRLSKILRWKGLAQLGVVSYGFYLFHELPHPGWYRFMKSTLQPHGLEILIVPIIFITTLVAAWVSSKTIERYFLSLKKALAPQGNNHPHLSQPDLSTSAPVRPNA